MPPSTVDEARAALFDSRDDVAEDPFYAVLRDEPASVRDRLAAEWVRFEPLADSQFLKELRQDPHARLWEMQVANLLLRAGYELDSSDSGPDLLVTNMPTRTWVECVAATAGDGPNRVPEPPQGVVFKDDESVRLLRCSTALVGKHKKWEEKYVPRGYVSKNDAHVVALNAGQIPLAGTMDHKRIPWITRMLYGRSHDYVTFGPETETRQGVERRFRISNANGTEVVTALFVAPTYASMSGVLYSPADTFNVNRRWARPIFVHNPNANVPLTPGWLARRVEDVREFYVDERRHIVEYERS